MEFFCRKLEFDILKMEDSSVKRNENGKGGFEMNRIRLVHVDTLSCEPILRRTPNGELLCISQCGGTYEPASENRVYAFHSKDNGESWSEPESIYPEDGNAVYATEVMVYDGVITAFLTIHHGHFLNWKCVMMKSYDSGYTWENAGAPPHLPTYAFIRGKIQLENGHILIPYHSYPVTQEMNDRVLKERGFDGACWHTNAEYVENGVLISTDKGKTFDRYPANRMDMSEGWIWSEPTIVELGDGTIAMLMRKCRSGWLWRCDSRDGGRTWSEVYNTHILNPSNKPKLIKIPDGRIALIHTPNNEGMGNGKWGKRFPLSIWISNDDMKTWGYREVVTDFPGSYSYSDGFYENGHILFTVEYNRHDILFIDHEIRE
jgi:hypothetical protein